MASKNSGIREDVYERLRAYKRGDESFSETLDRILHELDSDWRTNAGFLTDEEGTELEAEVASGVDDVDGSLEALGDEIDERLRDGSRSSSAPRFSSITPAVTTPPSPISRSTTRR